MFVILCPESVAHSQFYSNQYVAQSKAAMKVNQPCNHVGTTIIRMLTYQSLAPIYHVHALTVSGPPNVMGLCTVVVWEAPAQPNGEITSYELQFSVGQPRMVTETFTVTTTTERTLGTTVMVSTMKTYSSALCSGTNLST